MALPLLTLLAELPDGAARHGAPMTSDSFEVQACASLRDLWSAARRMPGSVAMVDWQRVGGLLSEEHRYHLSLIGRIVPLILVWEGGAGGHMSAEDLGVTAVLDRPIADGELLALVTAACSRRQQLMVPPHP
jgi:DNA-binding response OmpR family regulator